MIAATMTMDKTMLSAAFAATGLGDKSLTAASKLTAMGDAAAGADAKMAGLHGTVKGLVELYASLKIGEGLKKSVSVASEYQMARARMVEMGIPKAEQQQMLGVARNLQSIPGVSKFSALEMANSAIAGAPGASSYQQMIRAKLMPTIARAALVAKVSWGDTNSLHDIARNILGIVETRGKLQNLGQAVKAANLALKVMVGTEGKIKFRDQEVMLRNMGLGEPLMLSTKGMAGVEAIHEQFKAFGKGGSGGGNTQAGTIAYQTASGAVGGKMQKAQAIMLEQLGMLSRADVTKIRGSSQVYVKPGAMLGSLQAQSNPIAWLRHILDPHIEALIQKNNPHATAAQLKTRSENYGMAYAKSTGSPHATGTAITSTMKNEQYRSIKFRRQMILRAHATKIATQDQAHLLHMQMVQLDAAMETLGVQIGTALLPMMQQFAKWATSAADAVRSFNSQFPVFTKIEAWAGALAAVLLGIKGIEWLMGIRDGFAAIKALNFAGVLAKWGATAVLGEDAVAGLGVSIAALAGPIGIAVAALAGLGFAAYAFRGQIASTWAEFKHYLHPHAYPLPGHGPVHLGLTGAGSAHWGGGAPLQNISLIAMRAREAARVGAINPASVGYLGPVTAQGAQKAAQEAAKAHGIAMHHATAVANAHQKAIDHLFLVADKAAVKADAVAAKMNAAAVKLHLAFLAMTHPLGAKIMGINIKYGAISSQMAAAGHPGAAADALSIGQSKIMGIKYQSGMQHLAMLKANLHNTITGNAALVETGSMTKMQAGQANIAAQKQAAPAMVNILKTLIAMEKASAGYAHNLASQKIVANLTAQETKLKAMGSQLGYYSAKVKNITQNAMSGLFSNMMHGQKTWGQMFASFFGTIGKSLENILAKSISSAISNALFTKKTGAGISSIFSLLGSAFGGAGGGSSSAFSGAGIMGAGSFQKGGGSSTMSSIGGWVSAITSIAKIFGFATGANNIPNDMVANIHKGEMIIPAAGASLIRSGQASIGGMPGGNHVHLTVHAMDSQSVISALHSVRHEATQLFLNTASHLNLNGG